MNAPGMLTTRRRFLDYCAKAGITSTVFLNVVCSRLDDEPVTTEMIREAERLAGLEFTDAERALMLEEVEDNRKAVATLHSLQFDYRLPPAFAFTPELPGMMFTAEQRPLAPSPLPKVTRPENLEDCAFWPVPELAALLRSRAVTSVELTGMYLERLRRYDPQLHCIVSLTEDLAMVQARRADREIAQGRFRSLLHGIPWGAKDLLATRGIRTTWGAMPYRDQVFDHDATVVQRLDEAGAVLVAKLTMGALAWGDVWFGERTRNPWNTEKGSSGSSAGPGSATAAGLAGFSIGTETHGSIISPCYVNGITGLRPTTGCVSRYGAMALSWTLDKIGPMCRAAEDCALVFDVIRGPDGKDGTISNRPFNWDAGRDPVSLRVGYLAAAFEEDHETKTLDEAVIKTFRDMGINLMPVVLPEGNSEVLGLILHAEAAAAFDDLTRSNRDDLLVRQGKDAWPNIFRASRMIPAVAYIQANRHRVQIMQAFAEIFQTVDVFLAPGRHAKTNAFTNYTGHPCVPLPCGFDNNGLPVGFNIIGNLYGEAEALLLAKAYQEKTEFHKRQPPGFAVG